MRRTGWRIACSQRATHELGRQWCRIHVPGRSTNERIYRLGPAESPCSLVKGLADAAAGIPENGLQRHILATRLIDHCQDAKRPSVKQLVMDEVHAPTLIRSRRRSRFAAQQADPLAALGLHAQRQPFKTIQPVDPFLLITNLSLSSITWIRIYPKLGRAMAIARLRNRKSLRSRAWLLAHHTDGRSSDSGPDRCTLNRPIAAVSSSPIRGSPSLPKTG